MRVAETITSLGLASVVPFAHLVIHLGVPSADPAANSRGAVTRSLEEIAEAAQSVGVNLALELIPNPLSTASRLVQWLEEDAELGEAGICLDVGHAHLVGDVMDAIETCSGHIVTTHVHDNGGKRDDHLVPGKGTIDWEGAMMAFQKVGYDGAWMFELAPRRRLAGRAGAGRHGTRTTRAPPPHRAVGISGADISHGDTRLHRAYRRLRRPDSHPQGMARQPAIQRQDPFPPRA